MGENEEVLIFYWQERAEYCVVENYRPVCYTESRFFLFVFLNTHSKQTKIIDMLGLKKQYFLGIDFGTSYVKAVELMIKDGQPVLSNYGEVEMSFTEGRAQFQFHSPEERVVVYLKALLAKMKPKAQSAYVAMPGFSGLITLIEMPIMKNEELEKAIRFEAHKYIPTALEEVALSWDVISPKQKEGSEKKMEVLLVAALYKEVERYEKYLAEAGLQMDVLELETFSLVRSLVRDKEGTHLIIDIGSRATNLILVEGGVIKVNRNLNSGGNEITSTLADGLNISWERAEALKRGGRDFLNTRESAIIFPTFEMIGGESRRIFDAYKSKHPDKKVESVVLSGGTAKMKGLDQYFSKMWDISVTVGDPWTGIKIDDRLQSAIAAFGTSYSVALGLALGGSESQKKA